MDHGEWRFERNIERERTDMHLRMKSSIPGGVRSATRRTSGNDASCLGARGCYGKVTICAGRRGGYGLTIRQMSKAAKVVEAGKTDNVPFEEALKRLEGIVETMESEDLPLETLLARFEEGTKLVKVCQSKLAEAELKIQKLEKNSAGEPVLKPMPSEIDEEPN